MNLDDPDIAPGDGTGANLGWLADLWWLSTRRQWRHHGGALLLAAGVALLLGLATRAAPEGGEPYYFSLILLLCATVIVASPLILSMESVTLSRRFELLPVSPFLRWLARLLLSNTLRTSIALVVLVWGGLALAEHDPQGPATAARTLQLLGIVVASLTASLLIEDLIRHSRAVAFQQLVFLVVISFWPVTVDYLRTPSNFLPPPDWTSRPEIASLLILSEAPGGGLAVATLAPLLLAGAFYRLDLLLLARYQNRPPEPASSVRWTSAIVRALGGRNALTSPLGKELLVPLRFLFLRMTLVFLVLTALAGFVTGAPYLLLAAPFWWQPLSTNALGPDLGDGTTRYHLLGLPLAKLLRWRLAASIVITFVAIAATGLLTLGTGILQPPQLGPSNPAMFLVAFGYSLSLLPLWAIAGDRYSLRFPDRLEMHHLLPERTRSGGAAAVVTMFLMWTSLMLGAGVFVTAAALLVFTMTPGPFDTLRAALIALLAGAANIAAYVLHTRGLEKRGG